MRIPVQHETYFKRKKICQGCGAEYDKSKKYSVTQWNNSKFCSSVCLWKSKLVKDEHKSRGERWRRKRGMTKQGSSEFKKLISTTTKEAMQKPLVQQLIHAPRSPLQAKHRAKISKALTGIMPVNCTSAGNGAYANVQRGEYSINGKEIYFRSKWEANYALYLDYLVEYKQIRSWQYECRVFVFEKIQFGTRSYRPDFEVVNNDGSIDYHEVKGYMDSKSKTKLKRMKKYFPEIRVILIDKDFYTDLKKKMGKVLNFY